jgi:hypothetical protein
VVLRTCTQIVLFFSGGSSHRSARFYHPGGRLVRVAPTCSVRDGVNHESKRRKNRYTFAGTALCTPIVRICVALLMVGSTAFAQNLDPRAGANLNWRPHGTTGPAASVPQPQTQYVGASISRATVGLPHMVTSANQAVTPITATQAGHSATPAAAPRGPVAKVTKGTGALPNDHGQVWREYEISPYTSKVTSTTKPERAIVDWILRETGTEVWFSDPVGLLSASRNTLRVYHTPEIQKVVADVADRFVASSGTTQSYNVQMVTVGNPNWRATALRLMRPVQVQTPGIEAWLLTKENAALLANELRKRTDYREHNSSAVAIQNGQAATVSLMRPTNFMKSVLFRPGTWPGYEIQTGQVEQGFSLELSALTSIDGQTVDAVIKCNVDQVEKMVPVYIDVPNGHQSQRVQIQVPQVVSWRLHERFRWPEKEVLLISAGVVATPGTGKATTALSIPNPFKLTPPRADGLMFVASSGAASASQLQTAPGARTGGIDFRGRY